MSDGIYIGMAGATAREAQLDAIADDLANAQTPGFKGQRPVFAAVLAQQGASRAFPVAAGVGSDLRPGPAQITGNPLDVMPGGELFLGVRTETGAAYTRDGRLSVDAQGILRTAGLPVLSAGGDPIVVPAGSVPQISANGAVTADGVEVARLGLFELQGEVGRAGPSLFLPGSTGAANPVEGSLQVGSVELGNHRALDAAVELVATQRHFDAAMQAIDTYKRLGDRANELGRVR
jgi:flagellar basal-body rod protein FlgF